MKSIDNDKLIKLISKELRAISKNYSIEASQMAGAVAGLAAALMSGANIISFEFGDKSIAVTDNIGTRKDGLH